MTDPFLNHAIFVGGAPRSGTSVAHALLCTAGACNPYHPEVSFLRPVFESCAVGLANWETHTASFFAEQDHLFWHVRVLVRHMLGHIHRVLGQPAVLCLKDPLLTPNFPLVGQLVAPLAGRVQFVTMLRHPHEVIRSHQEIAEKTGAAFSDHDLDQAVRLYLDCYQHLDHPALQDRVLLLRYEDLGSAAQVAQLRAFTGLEDIDPAAIWGETRHEPTAAEQADPWFSPKYHRPIDTSSRLSPLDPARRARVDRACGPFMERFGYARG